MAAKAEKKASKQKNKNKDKAKVKSKDKAKEKSYDPASSEIQDEMKRLNRILGQVEGIKKMLDEGRELNDVLIQCKAVHSALKAVESRMLRRYLENAVEDITKAEKKKPRDQKIGELMDLYKPVN